MLASGYYASRIFCTQTCTDTIHKLTNIMAVSGILTDNRGANVFVTYSFLEEIASLVHSMRECAAKCRHPCRAVLDTVYPLVLIGARAFALWHLTYKIVKSEKMPFMHQVEAVTLTICSFHDIKDTLKEFMRTSTAPWSRGSVPCRSENSSRSSMAGRRC